MGLAPRRRAGHRRGQAAVFVAMVLFTLVILLAMATNIGVVVNDRIRMQNTADLATYAVAYTEAQALNQLTYLNTQIAEVVEGCRQDLYFGSPWQWPCLCTPTHPDAERIIQQCRMDLDNAIRTFMQAAEWDATVGPALEVGRATAEANFQGTYDKTYFMEDEWGSPTREGTFMTTYSTNMSGGGTAATIATYQQATVMLNYMYIITCPCKAGCCYAGTVWPTYPVQAWFWKDTDDPSIWVEGRVYGAPQKQFLDIAYGSGGDGGFFGASSTGGDDLLYAYAVAKPFEGSVGPTRLPWNQYAPWIGMMGVYSPGPWGSPILIPSLDLGMVEEYRARMAGLREDLAGTSPTSLAASDGSRNLGRMWNTGYFRH